MPSDRNLLKQIHALSAEPEDDELGLGPSWQLDQIREALRAPEPSPLPSFKQAVEAKVKFINGNRERLLEAWLADTGVMPSESCLVIQEMPDGGSRCWVERRAKPC